MSKIIEYGQGLKLQTPLAQLEVGKEGLPPLFVAPDVAPIYEIVS